MVWVLTSMTGFKSYDIVPYESRERLPEFLRSQPAGLHLIRVFTSEEEAKQFVRDHKVPMVADA